MKILSDVNQYFQLELSALYPANEINSIVNLILEEEMGLSRIEQSLKKDQLLSFEEITSLSAILDELKLSKPIQYILGKTEFYGLPFLVTPDVLIPRQETEELIALILKDCDKEKAISILDIGTGSGCIPISLKKNLPEASITSVDISLKALAIAIENASLNKLTIDFRLCNILSKAETASLPCFDVIVSNPPYVRESEKTMMHKNVLNNEPSMALFVSDNDPLIFYRSILEFAKTNLNPSGIIYFEINEYLGAEMLELANSFGYSNAVVLKDLNDRDRMMKIS